MPRCDECQSPTAGHLCHRCLAYPATATPNDRSILCKGCRDYLASQANRATEKVAS